MQTERNINSPESGSIMTRIIDRESRATWSDWSEEIKSIEEEIETRFKAENKLAEEWDPDAIEEGE